MRFANPCTMGLGTIFDHYQSIGTGDGDDARDLCWNAVEVYHDNPPCAWADRRDYTLGIQSTGLELDVDKAGFRA